MVKMNEPSTIGLVIRSGFYRKRFRFGTNLCCCRLEKEIGHNAGVAGSRSVPKQCLGQERSKPTSKQKSVELLLLHLDRLVGCCGKSGLSHLGIKQWHLRPRSLGLRLACLWRDLEGHCDVSKQFFNLCPQSIT